MRTLLVLAATLLPATSRAEVGVVVTGEATIQPMLSAQLADWLHDHGRTVQAGALEPEAISTLIDCFVLEDLNCARKVVDVRARSSSLVFARAEATSNADGTREVAITGYWFQRDHEAVTERRVCKRCTDQALHTTVEDLMLALVHEPPAPAATSTPDTDLERPEPSSAPPSRMLPIAVMAAGGAALLTGGILFAIDQDPKPQGAQQPQYLDTATGGLVLGAAGLAALGAGIYLYVTAKPRSTPIAAVTHGGAFFGWSGRF